MLHIQNYIELTSVAYQVLGENESTGSQVEIGGTHTLTKTYQNMQHGDVTCLHFLLKGKRDKNGTKKIKRST